MSTRVRRVPARLEPFGGIGWTIFDFDTARDAAKFVKRYPEASMRCWERFAIIDGELVLVDTAT